VAAAALSRSDTPHFWSAPPRIFSSAANHRLLLVQFVPSRPRQRWQLVLLLRATKFLFHGMTSDSLLTRLEQKLLKQPTQF
jgi:hypothetical protein